MVAPIGIELAKVAKAVGRAFDEALGAVGGSPSTWLILLTLKIKPTANQREIAAAVGIQGATLTHHLDAMEADGLLTRRRDPSNRRVHLVELTPGGEAAFHRMRAAAMTFDRQLRTDLADDDVDTLRRILGLLAGRVASFAGDTTRQLFTDHDAIDSTERHSD